MDNELEEYEAEVSVEHCRGLYVGQLDERELEAFNRMCAEGRAYRNFDHAGGILGMPKIGIRKPSN